MTGVAEVCAIVVTRDRRALLAGCLAALRAQERPPDRVLVVDNASSDGTAAWLRAEHPEVELLHLDHNVGGAGGFRAGMQRAHGTGAGWLWLMDDDCAPEPAALRELLAAADRLGGPALLSSQVVWTDGRLHPMNWPGFEREDVAAVVAGAQARVMPLRTATFCSLLVARGAVDRHGLPLARYVLWSDDIEFTARVLRHEPGYLVPSSVCVHHTARPHTALDATDGRFALHVRNTLWMLRGPAWRPAEKPGLVFMLGAGTLTYLRRHGWARARWRDVGCGLRAGLRPGAPRP